MFGGCTDDVWHGSTAATNLSGTTTLSLCNWQIFQSLQPFATCLWWRPEHFLQMLHSSPNKIASLVAAMSLSGWYGVNSIATTTWPNSCGSRIVATCFAARQNTVQCICFQNHPSWILWGGHFYGNCSWVESVSVAKSLPCIQQYSASQWLWGHRGQHPLSFAPVMSWHCDCHHHSWQLCPQMLCQQLTAACVHEP